MLELTKSSIFILKTFIQKIFIYRFFNAENAYTKNIYIIIIKNIEYL